MKLRIDSKDYQNLLPIFILVFLLFVVNNQIFAQTSSSLTFENVKAKAQKENKKILLYFSGSDWCAPCIKFKKTFIQSDAFKSFADQHLVVINADFPRNSKNELSKELTEQNESLADKYNPKGHFPMILILNSNGEVLKLWESLPNQTVDEFINAMK